MSTPVEPSEPAKDHTGIRLFVEAPLHADNTFDLDRGQSHYLVHVMRKGIGAPILVFNGRDGEWLAAIKRVGKKAVTLELTECLQPQTVTPDLELLFAPVKKLRLDFLVQKAVELGVSALRPVITERTNAKVSADRMVANCIEAAEQCGRLDVPDIKPVLKFAALLDSWPEDRGLVFCDETPGAPELSLALKGSSHKGPWSILIGPEGGFSDGERQALLDFGPALAVSLGPRIMRADTAALAALAVFQATTGDW